MNIDVTAVTSAKSGGQRQGPHDQQEHDAGAVQAQREAELVAPDPHAYEPERTSTESGSAGIYRDDGGPKNTRATKERGERSWQIKA